MKISKERLLESAASRGFSPDLFEKVIHLLSILNGVYSHPFLKPRFVLKGGTALNIFIFDLPRLSVDIDLNYIGSIDRDAMLSERPDIIRAIHAVCGREGIHVRRLEDDHAGMKFSLRYDSALGQGGNIELDLNFMFRVPQWPQTFMDARISDPITAESIPILDIHELAAGNISALMARHAARDLFDVHQLLTSTKLDEERLRLATVIYGATNRRDWRTVSVNDASFEYRELRNNLLPLLRTEARENLSRNYNWIQTIVEECREYLIPLLNFSEGESEFLNCLLDHGEINASLITGDEELAQRLRTHPGLLWKAVNVREFKDKNY